MRIFRILFPVLALAACSTTAFHGESTTFNGDNILRNDVLSQIRRWENLTENCHDITSVEAQINHSEKINGRWKIQETWTLNACGKQHQYAVLLRESPDGGTDFSVGRR